MIRDQMFMVIKSMELRIEWPDGQVTTCTGSDLQGDFELVLPDPPIPFAAELQPETFEDSMQLMAGRPPPELTIRLKSRSPKSRWVVSTGQAAGEGKAR